MKYQKNINQEGFICEVLREYDISEQAYARIFCIMHSESLPEEERVSFNAIENVWKRKKKKLTDLSVFMLMWMTCSAIRQFVLSEWKNCLFSAWIPESAIKKIEHTMDEMETLSSCRSIINLAAELTVQKNSPTAKIQWDDGEQEDDSETEKEDECRDSNEDENQED